MAFFQDHGQLDHCLRVRHTQSELLVGTLLRVSVLPYLNLIKDFVCGQKAPQLAQEILTGLKPHSVPLWKLVFALLLQGLQALTL